MTTVDFYPKIFLIVYPSLENFTTGIAINAEVHAGSKSYCSPCQIWICTKSALYSTFTLLVPPILNKIFKIIFFQIHFLSNFSQCYVLPVNPLDSTSIWKSTKCNYCQSHYIEMWFGLVLGLAILKKKV